MKWTELVPGEFERLVREGAPCVVPVGSLERHGEHIPFGCDLIVAETVAERAAELTPCVVFPGYFLMQVHEAACFTGTVNLPQALTIEVLSKVLEGIAANGFQKIVLLNGHGGNNALMDYFAMSQLDEQRDYVLYWLDPFSAMTGEQRKTLDALWEIGPLGHACEMETSLFMACRPGKVRLDLAAGEPVRPLKRFAHLQAKGVHNALWWYADYPENVVGSPAKATEEKGRKALDILVPAAAAALQVIKEDTAAPALQREFLQRVRCKGGQGR
jgi:creatinine amidohydrolase